MCPVIFSCGQSSIHGINAQLSQVMNIPIQMAHLEKKLELRKQLGKFQNVDFLHSFGKEHNRSTQQYLV